MKRCYIPLFTALTACGVPKVLAYAEPKSFPTVTWSLVTCGACRREVVHWYAHSVSGFACAASSVRFDPAPYFASIPLMDWPPVV